MRRRLTLVALPLFLTALSQNAEAQLDLGEDIYVQAANQFEAYWDTELEETVVDDRLDASITRGNFTIGATFLSHTPSENNILDPNDYGSQVQGVRKRWLEIQANDFSARVGDVYASFGRGLSLQIFEDQTVDFDNVLDGFYGSASLNDWAQLELISGTNSLGDPYQTIKGTQFTFSLPRQVMLGLEGVWSDKMGPEATGGRRQSESLLGGGHLGGSLSSLVGSEVAGGAFDLDFYGEYVVHNRTDFSDGEIDDPQGHGGYANGAVYLNLPAGMNAQILGEYKDFLRYELDYINPPTAFRSHASTLLNRGSHVANLSFADERGGIGELLISLSDQTRLAGSYGKTNTSTAGHPAWEAYGEIEQWIGHSEIVLRMAETEETILEGSDDIFFERITQSGTIVHPINDTYSLDITAESQGIQEQNITARDTQFPLEYRDNIVSATLNRAPTMSWAVTYEWSDNPRETRDDWIWAEWNIQLGSRHQLLLGGGQLRGGQLCSGGVCKLVDPFEGARVEFLTTF